MYTFIRGPRKSTAGEHNIHQVEGFFLVHTSPSQRPSAKRKAPTDDMKDSIRRMACRKVRSMQRNRPQEQMFVLGLLSLLQLQLLDEARRLWEGKTLEK